MDVTWQAIGYFRGYGEDTVTLLLSVFSRVGCFKSFTEYTDPCQWAEFFSLDSPSVRRKMYSTWPYCQYRCSLSTPVRHETYRCFSLKYIHEIWVKPTPQKSLHAKPLSWITAHQKIPGDFVENDIIINIFAFDLKVSKVSSGLFVWRTVFYLM